MLCKSLQMLRFASHSHPVIVLHESSKFSTSLHIFIFALEMFRLICLNLHHFIEFDMHWLQMLCFASHSRQVITLHKLLQMLCILIQSSCCVSHSKCSASLCILVQSLCYISHSNALLRFAFSPSCHLKSL